MAFNMKKYKMYLKPAILGTVVVLLTPVLAAYIPEIYNLGGYIGIGTILSAGIAAFATDMVIEKYM